MTTNVAGQKQGELVKQQTTHLTDLWWVTFYKTTMHWWQFNQKNRLRWQILGILWVSREGLKNQGVKRLFHQLNFLYILEAHCFILHGRSFSVIELQLHSPPWKIQLLYSFSGWTNHRKKKPLHGNSFIKWTTPSTIHAIRANLWDDWFSQERNVSLLCCWMRLLGHGPPRDCFSESIMCDVAMGHSNVSDGD